MSRVSSQVVPAVLAGVLAALLVPAPAGAAVWTPVVDLEAVPDGDVATVDVEVDDAGNATAVWATQDATPDPDVWLWELHASTRPVGGTWSPPVVLNAEADVINPQELDLAVGPRGDAVVVYGLDDGAANLRSVSRPVGGSWSSPTTVPRSTSGAQQVSVGIDEAGNAVVAWEDDSGTDDVVFASTAVPGAAWSDPPQVLAVGDVLGSPDLAVAPTGRAIVVWDEDVSTDDDPQVVMAAVRPSAGAAFAGTPEQLSPIGASAIDPVVAINRTGAAVAAWTQTESANAFEYPRVHATTMVSGGDWVGSAPVSPAPDTSNVVDDTEGVVAVIDPAGRATVGWVRGVGDDVYDTVANVESATGQAGAATWSAVAVLGPVDGNFEPDMSVDTTGNVAAVWSRDSQPPALALRPAGSTTWQAPVALGSRGSYDVAPAVASAPGGDVVAVWAGYTDNYDAYVSSTTYDVEEAVAPPVAVPPVVAPPVVPPTSTTAPQPGPKPVLSGVRLTKKKIHVHGSDEKPRVTKVRLTLNTPAKVVFVLKRTTKLLGKAVTAKLSKALPAGSSKVRLTSKVGRKKLKPGTYKVTVRASNSAGRTSATAGRLRLRP